ncbi:UNVERIFIED_CONTAM: hypothetical protein FKN15_059598 [Acipenser sinensis]
MKCLDEVESEKNSINAVNTSSINKGRFATGSETHNVLLNYNPVPWLSFNNSVQRLFELWEELVKVLNTVSQKVKEILPKLASLNLELQKPQLTIFDSIEVINTFRKTITDIVLHLIQNDNH